MIKRNMVLLIFSTVLLFLSASIFGLAQANSKSQKQSAYRPKIEITEPKGDRIITKGEPVDIYWKILNPPRRNNGWIMEVNLHTPYGCIQGGGRGHSIYSKPLKESSGHFRWIPGDDNFQFDWEPDPEDDLADLTGYDPPLPPFDVNSPWGLTQIQVCMYHDENSSDAYVMSNKGCHAVPKEHDVGYACVINTGVLRKAANNSEKPDVIK